MKLAGQVAVGSVTVGANSAVLSEVFETVLRRPDTDMCPMGWLNIVRLVNIIGALVVLVETPLGGTVWGCYKHRLRRLGLFIP